MEDFSINIKPVDQVGYKSINTLEWKEIPGFAILTGRNGSGKTQILELLAYHFSGARPLGASMPQINITGRNYKPNEVGFIPSGGLFSASTPSSLRDMHNIRTQAVQSIQNIYNMRTDIQQTIRAQKIKERLGVQHYDQTKIDEYALKLSDDFDFAIDDLDTVRGLSHVFLAFRIKKLESMERGQGDFDRDGSPLGPAPWTVVNEALKVAGFPYVVNSPESTPLIDPYVLKLKDNATGKEIRDIDLSSGEKVIFQLVLWLFAADDRGIFPKLLLLDEPDAHLHPSMTIQFLDVISEVLVKRHGVRVIMSSHSPSTVALAPEGSIFQVDRMANEVIRVDSRADIISTLTAGLVTVSRSTKFCFVEDEDDVAFYSGVYNILSDYGPSRDPAALRKSPSIIFVPVSIGEKSSKVSGGFSVVEKWVSKLDAEPLSSMFLGVIDRDASNVGSSRVFVLGRYSFENYLLDTLNIFSLLIEEGAAPAIGGLNIGQGDEHLLRLQSAQDLQNASDKIVSMINKANPDLTCTNELLIEYTNGRSVEVPSWIVNMRGHDLLSKVQASFLGTRIMSPPRLLKSLKRSRLIPSDLASLFERIQLT